MAVSQLLFLTVTKIPKKTAKREKKAWSPDKTCGKIIVMVGNGKGRWLILWWPKSRQHKKDPGKR